MAKYTELLSEYLNHGGALPAVFSQIEGFETLFIGRYIDCEIGYETPELFSIKLETRANLVIPQYLRRINEIQAIKEQLLTPTKKHVKTGNTERMRAGEIAHTQGLQSETSTNTKSGEIINEKGGDGVTETPGTVTVKTYDMPTGSPSIGILNGPTQQVVTENTKNTTIDKSTDTERYNEYLDQTTRTAQPSTNTESYNDYKETENYNNITDIEEGLTSGEALAIFNAYAQQTNNLKLQLLEEFNGLFMAVY